MRTLRFTQIVDSRFKGENLTLLKRRAGKIEKALKTLPGVTVKVGKPRKLIWGPPEPCVQWRMDFWVRKLPKGSVTWNTVYKTVNEVKAVPYHFE